MADLITFMHITSTGNTGDLASGPYRYFDFPKHRVIDYSDPIPPGPLVIGGGTMTNWLRWHAGKMPAQARPRIAWGIGSSRHGETDPWPDPEGFDLLGVREWMPDRENEGRWAPCVSCMSTLFDQPYEITRKAVRLVNPGMRGRYAMKADDLPTMDNTAPMKEVVAFLASAEIVVTNSYHGMYWATLLGRRVVCVPYSSKFHQFKYRPQLSADGSDWRERAHEAITWPSALESCRTATTAFYQRAMELLG